MFLKKLFKKNFKYTELKPKKKCSVCKEYFYKINYAVKKKEKIYHFCNEECYYGWLRYKAGLEPY